MDTASACNGGVISCKKDIGQNHQQAEIAEFPTTTAMKERANLLKDVGKVLEDVYQDPQAYYEVNATIFSEYYKDERVLLKDLLFPETSPLYKQEAFTKSGAKPGVFKTRFYDVLASGDFPFLKAALKRKRRDFEISGIEPRLGAAVPTDTAMEIFSNSSGVMIYFPYSENFGSSYSPAYFDQINTNPRFHTATIVTADREADSGPGREPYICGTRTNMKLCYNAVTVNDTYAAGMETHIIGVGIEPNKQDHLMPIPPGPGVNLVFLGDFRFTKNYDRLISLKGDGGGSEFRVIRGDNFLKQNDNGQITAPENTIPVDLKRKDKDKWKTINSIWDSNWEAANLQQVFGIYEEDRDGSVTFSGSTQTTLTVPGGLGSIVGNRGFSITVKSNDPIIRQLSWDRSSFYQYNAGGLNNGCGVRGPWTVYDCNTNVMYTLPQQ